MMRTISRCDGAGGTLTSSRETMLSVPLYGERMNMSAAAVVGAMWFCLQSHSKFAFIMVFSLYTIYTKFK